MGYRSDVLLAIAFKDKSHRDEVLAIYAMHKFVKEYDLARDWRTHDDVNGNAYVLWYSAEYVKWYESYEDVQGFEHMLSVAQTFFVHRQFPFAWHKCRIGEEDNDIETVTVNEDEDGDLQDYLWDHMGITREIRNEFAA